MPRRIPASVSSIGRAVLAAVALCRLVVPGHALAAPGAGETVQLDRTAPAAESCVDDQEQAFLTLINDERRANGLAPLQLSESLSLAAAAHSADMAATGEVTDAMSDGSTVEQNLRRSGYSGDTYGQNIAAGVETADAAFAAWQASPSHDANMLRPEFAAIGVARVDNPDSPRGWYWTTVFGGGFDAPATPCDPAATAPSPAAAAEPPLATTNDDVNLRSGPGAGFGVLETLPAGEPLTVTDAPAQGFLPVTYRGQGGWVAQQYVDLPRAGIATALLNFRSGPSRSAAVLAVVPAGTTLPLDGVSRDGYLGASFNGENGWVDAAFVRAAPASGAQSASPAPAAEPRGTATIAADLPLRDGPTPTSNVVAVIPAGSTVGLTGRNGGGFFEVSFGGQTGWADAAYLQ